VLLVLKAAYPTPAHYHLCSTMNIHSSVILPKYSYVTLDSSSNQEYFQDNSNQKFSTKLPQPIFNGLELEVGLVDLVFSPIRDFDLNVFPRENDKKIRVLKKTKQQFTTKKLPGKLDDFIKVCNQELEDQNLKISFSILSTGGGLKFVMQQGIKNALAVIDPEYARALGFKTEYAAGAHEAEEYFSQEAFDEIDTSQSMTINMYEDCPVRVEEPKIRDVSNLIFEINKSLTEFGITVLYTNDKFVFENKNTVGARVLFSDFLAKTFDIPKGYWFEKESETFPTFENINLGTKSYFINVVCNIVTPQPYDGRPMPILRTFVNPSKDGERVVFSPENNVWYVPVRKNFKFDTVEIQLLDEFMKPLVCVENSKTTAILHIKSRYV